MQQSEPRVGPKVQNLLPHRTHSHCLTSTNTSPRRWPVPQQAAWRKLVHNRAPELIITAVTLLPGVAQFIRGRRAREVRGRARCRGAGVRGTRGEVCCLSTCPSNTSEATAPATRTKGTPPGTQESTRSNNKLTEQSKKQTNPAPKPNPPQVRAQQNAGTPAPTRYRTGPWTPYGTGQGTQTAANRPPRTPTHRNERPRSLAQQQSSDQKLLGNHRGRKTKRRDTHHHHVADRVMCPTQPGAPRQRFSAHPARPPIQAKQPRAVTQQTRCRTGTTAGERPAPNH